MMTEKIKIMLIKKKMNTSDLARKLNVTPQNLYHKFKRDNFSTNELLEIAEALDCKLNINLISNDGDVV